MDCYCAKCGKELAKKEKVVYAEFVAMTPENYEKLVVTHGIDKVARMIEVLNNYKASKGAKYKSDYHAILNWVVDRVNEEWRKQGISNKPEQGKSWTYGY